MTYDYGHSLLRYRGRLRAVFTTRPLDEYKGGNVGEVVPIDKITNREKAASMSRHPGGKKIKAENRCWNCNHTIPAHSKGAHNGDGGCAYCRCRERPDKPSESA